MYLNRFKICSPLYRNYRSKTTYVVLLPETPNDTAEDNALLRTDHLPQYDELTPEKCWSGIGKLALEYETGVWAVEEKANDPTIPNTFNGIIETLDKLDFPLAAAWSCVNALYIVKNNVMSSEAYINIHERARKARVHKYQSFPIYQACKEIYATNDTLDEAQQRVVKKFLLEARLNGIELSKENGEIFSTTLKKLESHKKEFKKKVTESTNRFKFRINSPTVIKDFPSTLQKDMAVDRENYKQGPWNITLQSNVYDGFMEHCPVRELRQNTYQAYIIRASNHLSKDVNNSIHIEEIRSLRGEQARILGYENFAEMSMETKMAGNVENVLSMFTSLLAQAKFSQEKELSSLQEFAESQGFQGALLMYDIPFWRQKHKTSLYSFDERMLQDHFPVEHVLKGLFELCSKLFGIYVEEISNTEVSVWHPDVRFFNIRDGDDKYLSSFYLDMYQRPGEKLCPRPGSAWMLGCRSRSDVCGRLPVANLVFNFDPKLAPNQIPLLTLGDVSILFQKFGHALQYLLTTIPYSEASGLTNIEWDAVEICSNFMQNWLYEPSTLRRISGHFDSGLPLSESCIKEVIASKNHMAGYDLCSNLYLAHLDILLHSSKDFWLDVVRELWPTYKVFKLDKTDAHLCSFTPIMADVWAAAYYSHTWSSMVAADAFQAFTEIEQDEVQATGMRFRETFLSLGGGCHSSEVFRRFRGRDPSPEALNVLTRVSTSISS